MIRFIGYTNFFLIVLSIISLIVYVCYILREMLRGTFFRQMRIQLALALIATCVSIMFIRSIEAQFWRQARDISEATLIGGNLRSAVIYLTGLLFGVLGQMMAIRSMTYDVYGELAWTSAIALATIGAVVYAIT